MLLKARVLLDQFSDKLCKRVHSRIEADLEVQTNVHLKIQVGEVTHALSLESLCRPVRDGCVYQRRESESIRKSKFWDWQNLRRLAVAFVNLGLDHYPDLWFINPVAGQGGRWAEGYLNELCWIFT